MATNHKAPAIESDHQSQNENAKSLEELELSLPKEKWYLSSYLYFYQNFWCPSNVFHNVVSVQNHFHARDTDIILATKPKSGTTWLKAIAFAIVNRKIYPPSNLHHHPLANTNPHKLVPCLEYTTSMTHLLDLSKISSPRIIATHLPYHPLPDSVRTSGCRIVYICRNPFDTVVSSLEFKHLMDEHKKEEEVVKLELDEYVDDVCRGVEGFGPHWDHVLGYWKQSKEKPNKVLFLKYEDMKTEGLSEIKRLAQFLGVPFTLEEEESGAVDEILNLCSFRNLKEMEVNKNGWSALDVKYSAFFRKGEIGDWKNHFTPSMFELLDKVMQEKFHGSGLTFKLSP